MVDPINWEFHTPEQLTDASRAGAVLSRLLCRGELILLLGSGVSSDMGLPDWSGLVQRCASEVGVDGDWTSIRTSSELMAAIDTIRRRSGLSKPDMKAAIRRALYGELLDDGGESVYTQDVLANPLLSALGAMLMRSARGSTAEVFTLNFDDVLEWYLDVHGFSAQVVSELPHLSRGDVDVHLYHIHGFLPLVSKYELSSWMIFSQEELEDRLAKSSDCPWEALLLDRVYSKVVLAVGTSMRDIDLSVTLKRAGVVTETRPFGFVIRTPSEDADEEIDMRDQLLERRLIPITLDGYGAVARFLLNICQRAARLT